MTSSGTADRSRSGQSDSAPLVTPLGLDYLNLHVRDVPITGTRGRKDGPTFSVYVEDPDGHGVELEQRPH